MIKFSAALALAIAFAGTAHGKTLVFCANGSPEGFDPAPHMAPATFDASAKPIYNRLTDFEPGSTKVIPSLAESWEISPDGLQYTLHLRKGVKFHKTADFTPTRDFGADDVVFTFARQMSKDDPYYGYAGGEWPYFAAMSMPELIKSVERVDDATVRFTLTRAEAPFIADLAMDFASILSKEYADKLAVEGKKEMLDRAPVGTGPFQFVSYDKGAIVRFRSNPDYWGGKPAIDDLLFLVTPDPAQRRTSLQSGECLIADPAPADIAALKADPNLAVDQQEALDIGYLAFNTLEKPFDDPRVRKALNMAIDKQAIVDAVLPASGRVATGPLPPTVWSHDGTLKGDAYDPDAARKLLDDAGVSSLDMKLWAMPVARPYGPDAQRTAEVIKTDLAKIGVDANIVSYPLDEYLSRSSAKDHDGAVLLGWRGDNGDPDNFLGTLLGCDAVGANNRAEWCYQPFEDLIRKAKVTSDPAERARLYREAQAIFMEQVPWAPLAHSLDTVAMSKRVKNYRIDAFGAHRFDKVDLAE